MTIGLLSYSYKVSNLDRHPQRIFENKTSAFNAVIYYGRDVPTTTPTTTTTTIIIIIIIIIIR